jgi:hypothetical protein
LALSTVALPFCACILGIFLGLRFTVFVLVPFSLFSTMLLLLARVQSADIPIFMIVCVQSGYMIGLTGREMYGQLLARLNIEQSKGV